MNPEFSSGDKVIFTTECHKPELIGKIGIVRREIAVTDYKDEIREFVYEVDICVESRPVIVVFVEEIKLERKENNE